MCLRFFHILGVFFSTLFELLLLQAKHPCIVPYQLRNVLLLPRPNATILFDTCDYFSQVSPLFLHLFSSCTSYPSFSLHENGCVYVLRNLVDSRLFVEIKFFSCCCCCLLLSVHSGVLVHFPCQSLSVERLELVVGRFVVTAKENACTTNAT